MNSWKRLIPYLFLNILISALTTLGVLWWWDRTQRTGADASNQPAAQSSQGSGINESLSQGSVDEPPLDQPVIKIANVFGVGDLQNEVVRLERVGKGELSLKGWMLQDENGHTYTFPKLSFITGAIELYTRAGPDSVIELHWGLEQPVWQPGEEVRLLDPEGNLRASYTIP